MPESLKMHSHNTVQAPVTYKLIYYQIHVCSDRLDRRRDCSHEGSSESIRPPSRAGNLEGVWESIGSRNIIAFLPRLLWICIELVWRN